ncbi:hypothetical protein KXW38_000526, partial [Aspergillus fumigatus]
AWVLDVRFDDGPFHRLRSIRMPQPRDERGCAAGDAGAHRAIGGEAVAIADDFTRHDRSRPDPAHRTQQDVEDLRQFIQAGLAQEHADRGDARIVAQFVIAFPFRPCRRIFAQQ